MIDQGGRAGIFEIGNDQAREAHVLSGSGYRAVAKPDPERVRALVAHLRHDEAERVAERLLELTTAGSPEVSEADHQRLVELGYEHVSLAIRAEAARRYGDDLVELEQRHALAGMLPDKAACVESIQRYADLLVSFWQPALANAVFRRIETIIGRHHPGVDLRACVEAMRQENWVIDPHGEITRLIEAASVLNTALAGRYVVRRGNAVIVPGARLEVMQIAAKYEQERTESRSEALPRHVVDSLWWLSRDRVQERPTVVFANDNTGNAIALEVALWVEHDGIQNVVMPATLVRIPKPQAESTDPVVHNQRVRKSLETIVSQPTAHSWTDKVDSALTMTLRRLATEAVSIGST